MIVLPDAENHTIVSSFVWTKHRNVTDRQTGGRTDRNGLSIIAVCIASNADSQCERAVKSKNKMTLFNQYYKCHTINAVFVYIAEHANTKGGV